MYTKFHNLKDLTVNSINNTTPGKKEIREGFKSYWEGNRQKQNMNLNLGPKFFAPYSRQGPYMDILQTTEICAVELDNDRYFEKAERLQ